MARQRGALGERALLQLGDFTGGLNTRVSRFLVKDNQATEIMNFFFGVDGVLKVRPGADRKTTTSLGAGGIKGGVRYYPATGDPQLIADWGAAVYKSTDGGVTLTSILSGLTAFSQVYYVQTRDLLFRADGVNEPKKYNGTTVTKWGLNAPTSAPTLAGTTGGSLTSSATYKVKVTFVSATAESNGQSSEASVTLGASENAISVTNIPTSSDPQVTKRRLYRTKANGAIYYLDTEIANNTTTTATLTKADSALGAEMPEDKDPPPQDLLYVELFKNRLFGIPASDRRKLYFSELFEPEAWPADFSVTIPFPEGDKATGLKARGDLLFVFGTSTVFVVVGDSPFNFTVRQTYADEGFVSGRGIVEVENVVMGPTRFGFLAFDGATAKVLSFEIEPTLRKELDLTKIDTITGAYDIENRLVRWSVPLATGGRGEFVFDLVRRAWTRTDRKIGVYIPWPGAADRGELYTGDPDNGIIWQENVGTSDAGANITARFRSKTFDFGQPRYRKRLWHTWVDTRPSTGLLAITVAGDSGAVVETFSPTLGGSIVFYGDPARKYGDPSHPYGRALVESWDEGYSYDPAAAKDFLARHVEFLIEYTGQAAFELYRLDTEFETEPWLRKT